MRGVSDSMVRWVSRRTWNGNFRAAAALKPALLLGGCLFFLCSVGVAAADDDKGGFFNRDFVKGTVTDSDDSTLKSPREISKDAAFQIGRNSAGQEDVGGAN